MTNKISAEGLEKILTQLVEELEKQGYQFDPKQKESLIETVKKGVIESGYLNNFNFNLNENRAGISNLMKLLQLSLLTEYNQNPEINPKADPSNKIDHLKLLKPDLNKNELKELLENVLEKLKKNDLKKNKTPKLTLTPKQTDRLADELANDIDKHLQKSKEFENDEALLANNTKATDFIAGMLCSLYGSDTRYAGMTQVVTQRVEGNLSALPDIGTPDGESYMADQLKAEVGKPDGGAEMFAINSAIASGNASVMNALEDAIPGVNYTSPRPSAPGTRTY